MNRFSDPLFTNLLQLISIDLPEFYKTVPPARNKEELSILLKRVYIFYRSVVLGNILWWLAGVHVPSFDFAVGVSNKYYCTLLLLLLTSAKKWCIWLNYICLPANTQNGSRSLTSLTWTYHWLLWCRIGGIYHEYLHVSIPAGYSHESLALLTLDLFHSYIRNRICKTMLNSQFICINLIVAALVHLDLRLASHLTTEPTAKALSCLWLLGISEASSETSATSTKSWCLLLLATAKSTSSKARTATTESLCLLSILAKHFENFKYNKPKM